MKQLLLVLAVSLSGCTTYNGYPALIPLPVTAGAGVLTTNGVRSVPITVQSNGVSTGYTIITPVTGK